jgi:serine protease Do
MRPHLLARAGVLAGLLLLTGCNAGGTTAVGSGSGTTSTAASSTTASSAAAVTQSTATTGSTGTAVSTTSASTGSVSAGAATTSASASTLAATTSAATSVAPSTVAGIPTPVLIASNVGAPGGQAASANPFGTDAIINVAKKDTPGVVQITNEQVQLGATGNSGAAVPTGVGTGIVIDNQGHILTNDHVVRGAQKLIVTLANGSKEYPATLVGADTRSDLAVIRVDGANLPSLALGDSSKLEVGQWVVAIGNALALPGGPTVTAGVVGALGRNAQEPAPTSGAPGSSQPQGPTPGGPFLFDLVQTDAPINPGNSGGPLVDLNGDVVGINTLGAGQAEPGVQAEGIGFAIAINTAKKIADQLISQGSVTYAFLGVSVISNTPALASQYGLPDVPGAAVYTVAPSSPAAQAGIASKDVITKVGSTTITGAGDLQQALTAQKPGASVTVEWTQAGTNQKMSKNVTLTTAPTATGSSSAATTARQ